MGRKQILEAKNINIYKKLLNVFGDYCDRFPCSGVDRLFDILAKQGAKVLPSDPRALDILEYLVSQVIPSSAKVQNILNTRFRDLPAELRPINRAGHRHDVAFWCVDNKIHDQIKYLLNFEGGGKGFWSSPECKKVSLLDTKEKNNG